MDRLHDRCCSLSADSQRSPTRNAGSERVHSRENQTENHSFECLGYGASCKGPISHAPGIAPRARHDETGQPILRPTAAWRREPQGVCLRTAPYPAGRSTAEPWARSSIQLRKTSKKTVKPPVHWTPSSTPAQVRKRKRLGVQLGRPQPSAAAEGTVPCVGSVTRARREFWRPKNRRLSFPLFRETTKEDAISYRDWRSEIEDALEHGHDDAKVKEAMFASSEGMARDNATMIDEKGFCMLPVF